MHEVVWSPNSERIAVSFKGNKPGNELVALFAFQRGHGIRPFFQPIGLIRGPPRGFGKNQSGPLSPLDAESNKPVSMSFAPYFEHGALLAICWSDGQITSYPLYFLE